MCTITQWYVQLVHIGILNENHDDTEQIRDSTNLVDGYRVSTEDVARATCIRGVRATAVRVISNTRVRSQYFDREYYCNNTAVCTVRVCTSSLYYRTGMCWAAYC